MALGCRRSSQETWEQALNRIAEPYGLEQEVLETYKAGLSRGLDESEVALEAVLEWDLAEIMPDDDNFDEE